MAISDHVLSFLIPLVILVHLLVAPYSKVEESFNLQAIHDILRYGVPYPWSPEAAAVLKAEYDHFNFPGAVPRSFVGAVVIAGLSEPFIALTRGLVNEQVIVTTVRGVLGMLNSLALMSYARAAKKAFGRGVGTWYILLQSTQFHVLFYASRTLPNMLAFALTTVALQQFLPKSSEVTTYRYQRLGIYILTFTAIIFRSEIALLLVTQTAVLLWQRRTSLTRVVIPAGIAGTIVGLGLTLSIDSFFWQSHSAAIQPPIFSTPILTEKLGLLWPEYSAFHFNAIRGEASQWGTSPWYTYFTSSIPKLLINPFALLFLFPIALSRPATSQRAATLLLPTLSFVAGYSCLAHKEWRFIIYIVPHLTLSAALGAHWIWARRAKAPVMAFLLATSVISTFVASTGMLLISANNYPGGEALSRLHTLALAPEYSRSAADGAVVVVHLDVPVCMTGATRFLQDAPLYPATFSPAAAEQEWYDTSAAAWKVSLRFDKTEDQKTLLTPQFWEGIDWILSSEAPAKATGNWEVVDVVSGLKGIKVYRPGEEAVCSGEGWVGSLVRQWCILEGIGRTILRGWWVGVEMEDKVWIMKKIR